MPRRSPSSAATAQRSARRSAFRQRAVIAIAGVGALAGYLLASGAAAPVVSDAVALVSSHQTQPQQPDGDASPSGTTLNGKRVALSDATDDWMANDKRPEWSPERLVPTGPTGSDAVQPPEKPLVPQIQVPENPRGRNLFNQGAAMRHYDLKPRGACFQPRGRGLYVNHFGAVSNSAGSATVSWWDLGDPNTTEYQIDAVSVSDSGSVTTQTVAAPKACKEVTSTFTGLRSGVSYVFMLTATATSPEQDDRVYRIGRGQTPVLVVS